jgi:hypothetical protein
MKILFLTAHISYAASCHAIDEGVIYYEPRKKPFLRVGIRTHYCDVQNWCPVFCKTHFLRTDLAAALGMHFT